LQMRDCFQQRFVQRHVVGGFARSRVEDEPGVQSSYLLFGQT
jgi:hypothetical protein